MWSVNLVVENQEVTLVTIGEEITQVKKLHYLGSIIYNTREIEEDLTNRTKASWLKWQNESGILCDTH